MKHTRLFPHRLAAALLTLALAACTDDPAPEPAPTEGPLYAVAVDVVSPDRTWASYLSLRGELPTGALDVSGAVEITGSPTLVAAEGAIFVGRDETKTWTRYTEQDGRLVADASVSFANEGMSFLYTAEVVSPTQAFSWSDKALELIEWNPTTMTITKRHDLSGLERTDYGMEWRGSAPALYRAQDGVLFYYVAYTTNRQTYRNRFHVVLFDTRTGAWQLLEDTRCGETAGFGGFVDEAGDTYLFSDNFGALADILAGIQRPACLLRVKAGERRIDPDYMVDLNALVGGNQAWGLYYAGNGRAYTSGLNMARKAEFNHPYNFLFADIHPFYALDLRAGTGALVPALAPAGVGWNAYSVDGQLFLPRTTGTFTRVGNWETAESAVLSLDPAAGTATELFRAPGTISLMTRLR
ncbi:MAG TPA: hypothetical protein VF815_21095 [Myxococcaceae bacterium]|jgi:hypothetical protein